MTLEHVALNHPDPQAAARWYAEHLGVRVVKAMDAPPHIHFLADRKGAMLELYHNTSGPVPDYSSMNPYTLHLAFAVSDIETELERLVAAGSSRLGDPETNASGDRLVFLRDPWGVPLQLVKRAGG